MGYETIFREKMVPDVRCLKLNPKTVYELWSYKMLRRRKDRKKITYLGRVRVRDSGGTSLPPKKTLSKPIFPSPEGGTKAKYPYA